MNIASTNNSLLDASLMDHLESDDLFVDQIGKTVARSLDKELSHISPKVLQRLEKSRELALTQQKMGNTVSRPSNTPKIGFFHKLGPIGPVVVVLMLIFLIAQWQQNARIKDIVDVDTAILTDSVPPDAYADDGFRLFLKKMVAAAKDEENATASSTTANVGNHQESNSSKGSETPTSDPSNNQ